MKKLIGAIAMTVVVGGAALMAPTHVWAQNAGINILVMGEDYDRDTIPRDSRVFKRVVEELGNQLNQQSYGVYDETAVTLGTFRQGNTRRSDAEIYDVAKSLRKPPIDVVASFAIYASAAPNVSRTASTIKVRIAGRLLGVQAGRNLGSFEVTSPESWLAPLNCDRECTLETVGDKAAMLARDLGAVLGQQLAAQLDQGNQGNLGQAGTPGGLSTGYDLVFTNFTSRDLLDIEEYLVIFSGYKNHRPVNQTMTMSEFWYESAIDPAKLRRNLERMAEELNIKVRLTIDGRRYQLERLPIRQNKTAPTKSGW